MPRTPVLALGLLVAGCAAPAATLPSAVPASPEMSSASPEAASATVSLAPLAPAPRPDLPAPLRAPASTAGDGMGHSSHGGHAPAPAAHGHTSHDRPDAGPTESSPLADALDAYLAVHDALASDRVAPGHARAFADAWARATDNAPAADPHFWHARSEAGAAVRAHALSLADAADLDDARTAFGHLSAALIPLVEAHGGPSAHGLLRFTCGMRTDLPDSGVWLQRGAEPRNPYFGTRMLACATGGGAIRSFMDHAGHER